MDPMRAVLALKAVRAPHGPCSPWNKGSLWPAAEVGRLAQDPLGLQKRMQREMGGKTQALDQRSRGLARQ